MSERTLIDVSEDSLIGFVAVNTDQIRRRAPAMSPQERRTAIVRATLPLLADHGVNVTTKQIAQAAGIAEGTLFRVFTDKEELLETAVTEAFRTDEICARIRALDAEQDIHTRITEAGVLFIDHFARLGSLMQALATSGYDIREHHVKQDGPRGFFRDLGDAVGTLFAPDRDRFRLGTDELAQTTIGLLMSVRFDPNVTDNRTAVSNRVDALLHGALSSAGTDN